MPSDQDYQQTKRLKKNGIPLESPFRELAAWVSADYGVHVLNVVYDTIQPDHRPRLSVVLESHEDAQKFRVPPGNFNEEDQKRVSERFEIILSRQSDLRFKIERLLVIFVAFEPVARIEANECVTKKEIHRLKARLANEDLWEISTCFDQVTFFFYTDAQVKRYEASGLRDLYSKEYSCLVRPYDEFGYLQKRGISVNFDSKQNFDTNYKSNWFYYYR
jgi:hypothetical protein